MLCTLKETKGYLVIYWTNYCTFHFSHYIFYKCTHVPNLVYLIFEVLEILKELMSKKQKILAIPLLSHSTLCIGFFIPLYSMSRAHK